MVETFADIELGGPDSAEGGVRFQDWPVGQGGRMDIATQRTHQVLAYLAAMEKQGTLLTQNQLEKYARHPSWRVTTRNLLKSGFGIDSSTFSRTEYHETFVDYLQRMGWAHCKEDRSVHITPLGRAVLKHLDVPVVGPA